MTTVAGLVYVLYDITLFYARLASCCGFTGAFSDSLEMLTKLADQTMLQIQPRRKTGVVVSWSRATQVFSMTTLSLFICSRRTCDPHQMLRPDMNVPLYNQHISNSIGHISSPRNENETSPLDVEHCCDRLLLLTHKCDVIILMYGGMAGHPLLDY